MNLTSAFDSIPSISDDSTEIMLIDTDENSNELPELNSSSTEQSAIFNNLLSQAYPTFEQFLQSETETNAARALSVVASGQHHNLTRKVITEQVENYYTGQVHSVLNSQINKQANDLLGKFGKAKVNISIDKDGKLVNSEFHVLSPLYDKESNLFFSQVGVHNQGSGYDKRLIGNFGLGYRYEMADSLLGVNTFIDHDFTGSNTRLGLGGEYWADYLKLAANFYTPLSNWKESSVMKHYEKLIYDERPAQGFDIRAQGYLPNYPQLGGSLVYEQYFGEEVALFSTKDRQKDPNALTIGVDYTPVPLVTAQATHKIGEGNRNDSRFNLGLNLQLGTPIEQQLDPSNVAIARSLKGSRYDMVDRNYDIVFEYKQEDFSINLAVKPGKNSVQLGDHLASEILNYNVQSRSPIVQYTWIVQNSSGVEVRYDENAPLLLNTQGMYDITLEVITERGYKARSNTVQIVAGIQLNSTLVATNAVAAALSDVDWADLVQGIVVDKIAAKPPTNRLQYEFIVPNAELNVVTFDSSEPIKEPTLLYQCDDSSDSTYNYCEITLESNIQYQIIKDTENNEPILRWRIYIVGNDQIADENINFLVEWHDNENYYRQVSDKPGKFTSSVNNNSPSIFTAIITDENDEEISNYAKVNSTLKAKITLDDKPLTEDQIKNGQLTWVLYQPVPGTEGNVDCEFNERSEGKFVNRHNPNCFVRVVYHDDDGKLVGQNPRVENDFIDGELSYSIFRTQQNNGDADPVARGQADYSVDKVPNMSEQGYWIEINFKDEDEMKKKFN